MSTPTVYFISENPDSILLAGTIALGFDLMVSPENLWRDDDDGKFPGLAQCDVVLVEALDHAPKAPGYTACWQAALAQNKSIVLVALRGGAPQVPAPLAELPLVDVRKAVARIESSGKQLTPDTSTLDADFARVREALVDAIEDSIPADVANPILTAVAAAQAKAASNDPAELVSLLGSVADAHVRAAEHNAKGLLQKTRTTAHTISTRLIHLSMADDGNILRFGAELLDRWVEYCDRADLSFVATRVQLVRLARQLPDLDPDVVLRGLQERWTIMQQDENQNDLTDDLRGLFAYILGALTKSLVAQLDGGSPSHIAACLDRVVPLMRNAGEYTEQADALCTAAQIHVQLPGGALRAVRYLEEALRVVTPQYPAEIREFVLRVAQGVRERLESSAEQLLEKGDARGAWNAASLLTRLCRALPDQSRLAESLACFAEISRELPEQSETAGSAAAEARDLAVVYDREDLAVLLGQIDVTDT